MREKVLWKKLQFLSFEFQSHFFADFFQNLFQEILNFEKSLFKNFSFRTFSLKEKLQRLVLSDVGL